MSLLVYECQRADHAHEIREFEGVVRSLRNYYEGRKELALVIGNVNIGNVELDGIIVKEDAIIILELKDHSGRIVARMNGEWTCDSEVVRGGSNKTVFEQIQVNKRNLRAAIEKNGYFTSVQANDVQGLVVFSAMKALTNELDRNTRQWLHVSDVANCGGAMHGIKARSWRDPKKGISINTSIPEEAIFNFIRKLHLDESWLVTKMRDVHLLPSDLYHEDAAHDGRDFSTATELAKARLKVEDLLKKLDAANQAIQQKDAQVEKRLGSLTVLVAKLQNELLKARDREIRLLEQLRGPAEASTVVPPKAPAVDGSDAESAKPSTAGALPAMPQAAPKQAPLLRRRPQHLKEWDVKNPDEDQLALIEKTLDKSMLIAGCAGSGKSVIALHKAMKIRETGGDVILIAFTKSLNRYMSAGRTDNGLGNRFFYHWQWKHEGMPKADYVIVDEASQAFTAMFAAASKLGKGRLWVGDINQLAPIVVLNPDRVKDRGYDDLIDGLRFISCNREFPVLQLTKTYRLGERATSFTGMFYGNTLVSGSKARNDLTCLRGIANAEGGPALLLTDMSLGDKAPLSAITQVTSLVKSILAENSRKQVAVLAHRIPTVVAMQRATAREIGNKDGVLVETVAKIQGLTTDITIFVIPNTGYHYGLERRLFNVATSRAREHTIIIVDKSVFEHKEMDQDVLCYLRRLIGEQVGQNASAIEICSDNENDVLEVAIDGAKPLLEKGNNERRTESASDSPTVDITRINKVLDGLQVHLVNWMQPILSKVYPTDFWQKAVMNVLQPDQRDEVMDTGAQSLAELDMAALIAVFLGNFRAIRRETHIAPDVADLAKFVKKIRNIYSHKNAHKIAVPNVEDFTFHMSVVRRFLVALGTDEDNVISHLTLVASLKPQASAKSPTVVKGKGITITVK